MNPDAVKPLACPFCGRTDNIVTDNELTGRSVWVHAMSSVKDSDCGLRGQMIPLETWNRRTPPAGFALVPVEPTLEMMEAYYRAYEKAQMNAAQDFTSFFTQGYKAAVAAAPRQEGE